MKTHISIPNPIYHAAEKLDDVYTSESSTIEPELIKMQIVILEREQW